MSIHHVDVLIVGAGHAGAQAAIALRQAKFAGSITIIGDERHPPYERPPLTKAYMAGEKDFDRILIRPTSFWQDRDIDLVLGEAVVRVDADAQSVTLLSGRSIQYGTIIWAAGGRARNLNCDGGNARGVHTVRTRDDVDALLNELGAVEEVVIIGGGYIGLETAAALSKLGKKVTVVEALDRVLARVAGEPLSRFFEAEHRAHGVTVLLRATVERIEQTGGTVSAVRLADGSRVPAQIVIVGIGIVPAVEPLLEAGVEGSNGVLVDAQCRTNFSNVFAVRHCALHLNEFAGGREIRLESVQNAIDQATVAAKVIAGYECSYGSMPWFWSDQYDLKLQTIGISTGFDLAIVRGEPASRSFSIVYVRDYAVIAVDCVNSPRDYVHGRALITARTRIDAKELADHNLSLKEIALAAASVEG